MHLSATMPAAGNGDILGDKIEQRKPLSGAAILFVFPQARPIFSRRESMEAAIERDAQNIIGF